MAGFFVDQAMQVLYARLEAMGYQRSSSEPDEWDHPGGMQVRMLHVAGTCEIRYRHRPPQKRSGSIMSDVQRDRAVPWSMMSRVHGEDAGLFVNWLQHSANVIETHTAAHVLVSKAPGE